MQDSADIELSPNVFLELREILDIKAAAPLTAEFLALGGRPIDVDASRVMRLGGLCLQVLLSAAITWKIDENAIVFVNPSADFLRGLTLFGVSLADLNGRGKTNDQNDPDSR